MPNAKGIRFHRQKVSLVIAVVDEGVANLTSVMAALRRLGAEVTVTTSAQTIKQASHVILLGVGAAAAAMARLLSKGPLSMFARFDTARFRHMLGYAAFVRKVGRRRRYALSWDYRGRATFLLSTAPCMPVPHMRCNQLQFQKADHPLLNVEDGPCVYFVHSYALPLRRLRWRAPVTRPSSRP